MLREVTARIRAFKRGVESRFIPSIKNRYPRGSYQHAEFEAGSAAARANDPMRNTYLRKLRIQAAKLRGNHSPKAWTKMQIRFEGRCVRCLKVTPKPEKDHITPIYQGGSHAISNIQPLCSCCNRSKGPERIDWRPDFAERLAKLQISG